MQEVYILALKNIKKLNDSNLFIAWLNRISFNVCFDMSKKNAGSTTTDSEVLEAIPDDYLDANPEAYFQRMDENLRLQKALDKLPFQEKQVIIMRYYNDMKLDEIADALVVSRSSVKRYLANAQKTLNRLLAA